MSPTQHLDASPPAPLAAALREAEPSKATVRLWVGRAAPHESWRDQARPGEPSVVLGHPAEDPPEGRINLAHFGCAHRVTAIAFTPGPGCSSVTLREALDTSSTARVAEYQVSEPGFTDLYAIGWAARTAELVFNP